jgi:glycosyltransferase involved in cell wall biosynthesis
MSEKEYIKDQVTVVIPVYNEEHFLRQALESVVEQVDCVIIGDNASSDGTEAIGREFAEIYPHIKYFRHEKNFGSVWNSAYCYKLVKTEFVFHIGGHDMIPPDYVAKLKETLKTNHDVICAYSDVQFIDCDGKNLFRQEFNNPDCNFGWGKMLAPHLVGSCSLRRASEFIFCNHPDYVTYGLFYTESIMQNAISMPSIALVSVITVFRNLLKGKFVHCNQTNFFCRDVHLAFSSNVNEYLKNTYMERITGYDSSPNYKQGAKFLLECFCNASQEGLTTREWKKLNRKMLFYCAKNWKYSGNLVIDLLVKSINLFQKIKSVLKKIIFYPLQICYKIYPLRVCYRAVKSFLIPGYAEKIRKEEEYEKEQSNK